MSQDLVARALERYPQSTRDLPPRLLYKYKPFDGPNGEHLRQIIQDHQLWAGSPASFNDPYDCVPVLDDTGTLLEKQAYVEKVVARRMGGLPSTVREARSAELRRELLAGLELPGQSINQNRAWRAAISAMGLVSLTDQPASMPLWAHYANNHSGVCFEFDTSEVPLALANRVIYGEVRPTFRMFEPVRGTDLMERVLLRKAPDWEYEHEWRIFDSGKVGLKDISRKALKAVILGANIGIEHEAAIRAMISLRDEPVDIRRATFNERLYTMTIINA